MIILKVPINEGCNPTLSFSNVGCMLPINGISNPGGALGLVRDKAHWSIAKNFPSQGNNNIQKNNNTMVVIKYVQIHPKKTL